MELHTVGVNGGYYAGGCDGAFGDPDGVGRGSAEPGRAVSCSIRSGMSRGRRSGSGTRSMRTGQGVSGTALPAAGGCGDRECERCRTGMKQGVGGAEYAGGGRRRRRTSSRYLMAQRFVADEPPPALVDRMAKTLPGERMATSRRCCGRWCSRRSSTRSSTSATR